MGIKMIQVWIIFHYADIIHALLRSSQSPTVLILTLVFMDSMHNPCKVNYTLLCHSCCLSLFVV